ncbi:hypothetical protein [Desulfobotulus alkaliphilus]|uniref:hypothetical protein n=1 Tax=Desulfobotulus alkaliphilus TaxID=622671 RepID=UPI00164442B4|nr:hypothetical protein [Desulfobotulus alkaliphilus]
MKDFPLWLFSGMQKAHTTQKRLDGCAPGITLERLQYILTGSDNLSRFLLSRKRRPHMERSDWHGWKKNLQGKKKK